MWLDQVIDEGRHVTRLHSDLPFFAEQALKLRPKFGPLEPFKFNSAQHKLHELIEEQKQDRQGAGYRPQGSAAWRLDLRCRQVLSGHHGKPRP